MATNNGSAQTRAARALDRILNKPRPATLGWQKSDTEIVITAPGGLGRVYITWPESGTRDTAVIGRGVPLAGRLPILVVPGAPNVIVDIDSSDMAAVAAVFNDQYGTLPHPLSSHQDVLLTTLSNDEVLAWDATAGKWVNVAQAGALVTSVNGQTGAVVLDADDIDDSATTNKFATAAELADIASAVQPGDLATVATTGAYSDLSGTPTIPADTATAISGASTDDTITDASLWGYVKAGVLVKTAWSNIKTVIATYLQATFLTFTQKMEIAATATTGAALRVVRDLAAASTDSPVVEVVQDNAGDDQVAVRVQQDGSGDILLLVDGATIVLRVLDGGGVITGTGAVAGTANLYLTQLGAALMRINSDNNSDGISNPEIRFMLDASTKIAMGYLRSDDTFRIGFGTSLGSVQDMIFNATTGITINGGLNVVSTGRALIVPRMTTTQRDAIPGITNGSIIYNTSTNTFQGRAGGAWTNL